MYISLTGKCTGFSPDLLINTATPNAYCVDATESCCYWALKYRCPAASQPEQQLSVLPDTCTPRLTQQLWIHPTIVQVYLYLCPGQLCGT